MKNYKFYKYFLKNNLCLWRLWFLNGIITFFLILKSLLFQRLLIIPVYLFLINHEIPAASAVRAFWPLFGSSATPAAYHKPLPNPPPPETRWPQEAGAPVSVSHRIYSYSYYTHRIFLIISRRLHLQIR